MFETYSKEYGRSAVFVDDYEQQLLLLFELCESCGAYKCWVDQNGVLHEFYLVKFDDDETKWYSPEDLFEIFSCRES